MGSCCLQVLLVASISVLGISGGFATFWAYFNFPSGEDNSLKSPVNTTSDDINDDTSYTPEYDDYLTAKWMSSNYENDSRTYVILPGSINALASAVLLLACLFSRKIYSSTSILYTAVSLWAVNLAVAILFQDAAASMLEKDADFKPFFFWILSFHVLQLIMLTFQAVLAGMEMRWQKVAWPTLNASHLFTPSTIVLTAMLTLSVFCMIVFTQSFQRGVEVSHNNHWPYLMERVPDYCVFPAVVFLVYGMVVNAQNILCHLLGSIHVKLMGITNLLAGILYCCVGVTASPAIVYIITGHRSSTFLLMMVFALCGGLLSIIHGILCLAQPDRMTLPPKIVKDIGELVNKTLLGDYSELKVKNFSTLSSHIGKVIPVIKSKYTGCLNIILAVFSMLSLLFGSIGTQDYPYITWNFVIMIVGDSAVLCRLIPFIVSQIYTKQEEISAFKMMIHFGLEAPLTLIGGIAAFCTWSTLLHLSGVCKIIIFLIMMKSLANMDIKNVIGSLKEPKPCRNEEEGNNLITETEEDGTESEEENTMQPYV